MDQEEREKIRTKTLENTDVKRIDPQEFRDNGYLQEINRQFLHPLGMALEMVTDSEGNMKDFGGIWDYRNDPEGIYFDIAGRSEDNVVRMRDKAAIVEAEWAHKAQVRKTNLGFIIEPVEI